MHQLLLGIVLLDDCVFVSFVVAVHQMNEFQLPRFSSNFRVHVHAVLYKRIIYEKKLSYENSQQKMRKYFNKPAKVLVTFKVVTESCCRRDDLL